MSKLLPIILAFALVLSSCGRSRQSDSTPLPSPLAIPAVAPLSADALQPANIDFREQLTFQPEEAKYLDLITEAVPLNADELELLGTNGFVTTDRHAWARFIEAYAWIYWKDLPVLVTTDSILHTVHQSYSDILQSIELIIIFSEMDEFLDKTHDAVVKAEAANDDEMLAPLYADVKIYLETAHQLLLNNLGGVGVSSDIPAVLEFVQMAEAANSFEEFTFAGVERKMDFTLFQPRGHYSRGKTMQNYFRSMTWLAQIDFRFVTYSPETSEPTVNPSQIAATAILHQAIQDTNQRARLDAVNMLFETLVGKSDNMTLFDFERFQEDIGVSSASDFLTHDENMLITQLMTNDYGQQRITGQIIERTVTNDSADSMPRPVSFMLLGQRFGIDSYILGNLVYDRLMVDGQPVERALPLPLDLMVAFGNERALTHIEPELEKYNYAGHLAALRTTVEEVDDGFWGSTLYNQWLGLIRTLNISTTTDQYPQTMQTSAWADKMLQTQVSSWSQLRHDNLLYIKQSFSNEQVSCEYPAGYVEPYPAFYAALYDFAATNQTVLMGLDLAALDSQASDMQKRIVEYYSNVMDIAEQLRILAEKELRLEEFTADEELWLKSIMVEQKADSAGCGGPLFEDLWDGWYQNLFFQKDESPALIADVHTNPTTDPGSSLYPPRVLHVATGEAVPTFFVVDTDEGETIYVGPTFSYFELITEGSSETPAKRMTDEDWKAQLKSNGNPVAPEWTESFRLPHKGKQQFLKLPTE